MPSTDTESVSSLRVASRIVMDPVATGTRCADPMSFPASSGITFPIACAAPVVVGTILIAAALDLLYLVPLSGASGIF